MTHASVAGMSPRLLMNGILAGSEEGFDLQVSIDLLEEKFYAPTQLVKTAADQSWEDKLFVRHINTFPVSGSREPTCQIFSVFLRAASAVAIRAFWSQRRPVVRSTGVDWMRENRMPPQSETSTTPHSGLNLSRIQLHLWCKHIMNSIYMRRAGNNYTDVYFSFLKSGELLHQPLVSL